jgi:hypothetical protein
VFEVSALSKRTDLTVGLVYVPPPGAMFKPGELPPQGSGVFLTRQQLMKFRTRDGARGPLLTDAKAPAEGLTAVNRSDALHYLLIDGVPVAWVRPHSEKYLIGPRPGRYMISWRDFLGLEPEVRKLLELPARVVFGDDARPPTP